jgi:antitoxin component YwqK of YwqJK toxin-antitoxin module
MEIFREYHKNGNLEKESNCKDGKREGVCKVYYENGNLKIEANYKNGKSVSIPSLLN